jgi:hypothetical protein
MTADEYDTGERPSPSDRPEAGGDRAVGGDAGSGVTEPKGSSDCDDADRPRGPTDDSPRREFVTETPSATTSEELLYV